MLTRGLEPQSNVTEKKSGAFDADVPINPSQLVDSRCGGEPLTVETTVDFHNGRVISDIEVCACAPGSLHLCICLLKSNV